MNFAAAGSTSDLAPGATKGIEVEGQSILLANVGGAYFAIQRKCPHMGFDLCKGTLVGARLTCRMHGATFDVTTGEAVGKAKLLVFKTLPKPAKTYPVKVEGDRVMVGV